MSSIRVIFFSFIAGFLSLSLQIFASEPVSVYLTLSKQPDRAMTVQWITPLEEIEDLLFYRKAEGAEWLKAYASYLPLPNHFPYALHRVELTKLDPESEYSFRIGSSPNEYKFATLPSSLKDPLRFVVGGDIYHDEIEYVIETNLQAASRNPHFAILGGDIAYATNRLFLSWEKGERWLDFLKAWSQTMITPQGRLIPIVAAIGNHDVTGRFDETPDAAPFFYMLFSTPGYQVLDIGDYLSLFLLDSGHTHPVGGDQARWLFHALQDRETSPHKFAVYHVPAYPSVRDFKGTKSVNVRAHWVPIFEKFGLHAAFEHHDHCYKRTYPIRKGKKKRHGVIYLGDGAWGVRKTRKPKTLASSWYLAKTKDVRHFILVTLDKEKRYFQAISHQGVIFDEYTQ